MYVLLYWDKVVNRCMVGVWQVIFLWLCAELFPYVGLYKNVYVEDWHEVEFLFCEPSLAYKINEDNGDTRELSYAYPYEIV